MIELGMQSEIRMILEQRREIQTLTFLSLQALHPLEGFPQNTIAKDLKIWFT